MNQKTIMKSTDLGTRTTKPKGDRVLQTRSRRRYRAGRRRSSSPRRIGSRNRWNHRRRLPKKPNPVTSCLAQPLRTSGSRATVGDDWNECRVLWLHFQSSRPHYQFCTAYLEPTSVNVATVPLQGSIFHLEADLQAVLESVLPISIIETSCSKHFESQGRPIQLLKL
jgi:hypothetical protein